MFLQPGVFLARVKEKINRSNIYAHVRPDDRFICLSEHEVRDQDIKERLHFDQGEALAYAGLRGNPFVKVLAQYAINFVREVQRRTSAC
jgi:hypothetical protein